MFEWLKRNVLRQDQEFDVHWPLHVMRGDAIKINNDWHVFEKGFAERRWATLSFAGIDQVKLYFGL